ncbi:MAG: PQQ-like beta-propeller repeat protein [Phycisphaerales bacterium]|nr:PQQ-like beta-propeller repeat protein [Phycisphaerales bacterium]
MKSPNPSPAESMSRSLICSLALGALLTTGCASKSAWRQWGGPQRDFTVETVGLAQKWPDEGPTKLWSRELGDGYSSIVSNGHTLYTMYRGDDDHEVVVALDAKSGKTRWEYKYPAPYIEFETDEIDEETGKKKIEKQTTQFGSGPNSTPLLVNNRLYTIGFTGKMKCLSANSGKLIWSQDLYKDMNGSYLRFGYAASPIAYGKNVIALVGGVGNGVVAFDQKTGAVDWKSTDFDISYSSPILIKVAGKDHLVAYMSEKLIGISPETGELHWSIGHKNRFGSTICTPVWCPGNILYFVTGGDTAGGRAIRLDRTGYKVTAQDVWSNKKLQGGLNNAVRIGNHLYGPAGGRKPFMVAFDTKTGKIAWRQRDLDKIKAIYADGKLILLDGDGHLMLATADADGLEIHSKAKLLEKEAWTTPTLVDTKLYLRDRKTIMAVDLG